MRSLVFISFIVFITIFSCKTPNSSFHPDFRFLDDSIKLEILKKVDYSRHIGEPVGGLLKNDTVKFFIDYTFIEGKPYTLSGLLLSYSKDVTLLITVNQVTYQKDTRYDEKWDYGLLQKEKISKVILKYKSIPVLSIKL